MLDRDFHPLSWFDEANPLGWFDRDLTSEASSSTPRVIIARPVVGAAAAVFARHLVAGAFAVHSFVGRPAPTRRVVAAPPVATHPRITSPSVRSFIGRQTFVPAPSAVRVIAEPTISSPRMQLPRVKSVLPTSIASTKGRGPFARPIISKLRLQLPPRTESFVGFAVIPPPPPAPPASLRIRPTISTVRIKPIAVDSVVGLSIPKAPAQAPPRIYTRPTVSQLRTILRPAVESYVGLPARRPVALRGRMPIVSRIRAFFVRVRSVAGSGIARGTARPLTLAIANSTSSNALAGDRTTAGAITPVQNVATFALGPQQANSIALSPSQSATNPLTTSE